MLEAGGKELTPSSIDHVEWNQQPLEDKTNTHILSYDNIFYWKGFCFQLAWNAMKTSDRQLQLYR
jgi:hypothetical protein